MTTNKPEVFEVYRTRQGTLENVVLLADYEALQAEYEKLLKDAELKHAALEREVEELRKDAERYQWLKDKRMFRMFSADMTGKHTFTTVGRPIGSGRNIDEAIDAEISKALAAGEAG